MLNVAGEEDDDGNAAVGKSNGRTIEKANGNGHVEASAPEFQPIPAVINATQARAFWSAVKQGAKTEKQVLDYFGALGIERTEEMRKSDFDAAMIWACRKEA